jgi:tetratricopeptide (TPR) repeat protein
VLELVAAVAEPLEIVELASILKWDEYTQEEVLDTLGSLFPRANGRLRAFHGSVLEWLTNAKKAGRYRVNIRAGYARLADHCWSQFQQGIQGMSGYAKRNLYYALWRVDRWDNLAAALSDPEYLEEIDPPADVLLGYWFQVQAHSTQQMIEAYRPWIEDPLAHQGTDELIEWVLYQAGYLEEAFRILEALILHYRQTGMQQSRMAWLLSQQAAILGRWGELEKVWAVLEEAEAIFRKVGSSEGLANVLAEKGAVLRRRGNLEQALECHRQQEQLSRPGSLRWALAILEQGEVAIAQNQFDEARRLLSRAAAEQIRLAEIQLRVKAGKARLLMEAGQDDLALKAYQELIQLSRHAQQSELQCVALGNLGILSARRKQFKQSRALLAEAIMLARKAGDRWNLKNFLFH